MFYFIFWSENLSKSKFYHKSVNNSTTVDTVQAKLSLKILSTMANQNLRYLGNILAIGCTVNFKRKFILRENWSISLITFSQPLTLKIPLVYSTR